MNKVIEIARACVGQREVGNNESFADPDFQKRMKRAGWYSGAPWCGYFCRMVYEEAGMEIANVPAGDKKATLYVTGSSVQTMRRADRADNWHAEPVPGAIAVWRYFKGGQPTDRGHMAIVTEVYPKGTDHFQTVEGNTNNDGSREGKVVAQRTRKFEWRRTDGLRLMGFVHPKPM